MASQIASALAVLMRKVRLRSGTSEQLRTNGWKGIL